LVVLGLAFVKVVGAGGGETHSFEASVGFLLEVFEDGKELLLLGEQLLLGDCLGVVLGFVTG
jgi:hypothetical protein